MTTIVDELARRATPGYVGEQIKEATMKKTKEMRERAVASPYALPLLGGAIGAIAASYLGKRREAAYSAPRYDYGRIEEVTGYAAEEEVAGEGIAEKARELKDKAVDTISGVGERSSEAISGAKDKVVDLGGSAKSWFSRALDEQPLLIGAGIAVFGALAAMLTPVSEREKELVEPARKRASEKLQELGDKIEQKLEGTNDEMADDFKPDIGEPIGFEAGEGDGRFPPIH